MYIVGLTGGISSGKSTVSNILRDLGVEVIDADVIAREVVEPGRKAWKQIKSEFGPGVFNESGEIDRPKLGEIIFSDREKRHRLDAITHPEIYKTIFWKVIRCFLKGHQFVVLDLPLLFESKVVVDYCYKIIVVLCEEEQQLQRLIKRNGLSEEEAMKRIQTQMPLEEKCKKAHFVIDNSGSIEDTHTQVKRVHNVLKHSKYHWRLRLMIVGWLSVVIFIFIWFTGFF